MSGQKRGQFKPGAEWRGNAAGKPRGPNKKTADVKAVAGQYTGEAIERLAAIMRDPKSPPAAVVAAANAILDRAVGRPSQAIEQTIQKRDVKDMTDDELLAIIQSGGDGVADPEEDQGQPH